MLAGLTQLCLLNFTRRRGAHNHGDAYEWIGKLLAQAFCNRFQKHYATCLREVDIHVGFSFGLEKLI
jgi:hypothetical protein